MWRWLMVPQNNNNGNTDHTSPEQYINNEKVEILWEFWKCDTETQSGQMLMEKWLWQFVWNAGLPQTFSLLM